MNTLLVMRTLHFIASLAFLSSLFNIGSSSSSSSSSGSSSSAVVNAVDDSSLNSSVRRRRAATSKPAAAAAVALLSTIPANPLPYHEIQPDGSSTPALYFKGDGRGNFEHDREGHVVMRDEEGWYVYAEEGPAEAQAEAQVDDDETTAGENGQRQRQRPRRRQRRLMHKGKVLLPGKHRVGTIDAASVPNNLVLPSSRDITILPNNANSREEQREPLHRRQLSSSSSSIGTFRSLVILVRFRDHRTRDLPTQQQISNLYNFKGGGQRPREQQQQQQQQQQHHEDAPSGSVHQVYLENSYGLLDSTAYVTDWIDVSGSEAEYANGEYGFHEFPSAIREALDLFVESIVPEGLSGVDRDAATGALLDRLDRNGDGTIDGLGILHSGYGAEFAGDDCYGQKNENRIWSHQAGNLQWSHPQVDLEIPSQYYVASALRNKCKSEIVRVGIVAHEIGHQLGLPDLYDKTWEGNGIGNFDQMARCWGWDGSGLYPPTLSAWSKIALNWLTPLEISSSGSYALGPSAQVPHAYIIKEGYPEGEYLLIENRQPIGFDAQLPQGGIAIWHIDEKADDQNDRGYLGQEGWPKNGNHYKVALLQADGNHDLEMKVNTGDDGDLWHNNSQLSILGPSIKKNVVPNSDAYQDGNVYETGIWIHEFSESGTYMSFEVKGLNGATSTSYLAPNDATLSPTSNPSTQQPTSNPSSQPSSELSSLPSAHPSAVPIPTLSPLKEKPSGVDLDFILFGMAGSTFSSPTIFPTASPSTSPSESPSSSHSPTQSHAPTSIPSESPTVSPSQSDAPSPIPSTSPTISPSQSHAPSPIPSASPTISPSLSTLPTLSTSPTSPPSVLPTAPPSFDPEGIEYYYPDFVDFGCRRKPFAEFEEWEHSKFFSLADCCYKSMPWEYMGCINKSVEMIYLQNTSQVSLANAPNT